MIAKGSDILIAEEMCCIDCIRKCVILIAEGSVGIRSNCAIPAGCPQTIVVDMKNLK